MASTNTYRGVKSTTFMLVLMGFWTGTILLVFGYISDRIWETSVLGLLSGYVIRAAIGSAAEAYVTVNRPTGTDTTTSTSTVITTAAKPPTEGSAP